MFKKFLVLFALASICTVAKADNLSIGEIIHKIPAVNTGVAYSIMDSKFNYLSTIKVAQFGRYVNLEAGYAGDAENTGHKLVGVLSVNLIESGYVHFPILKYFQFCPGIYIGAGNINIKDVRESEVDYGVSATFFKVNF